MTAFGSKNWLRRWTIWGVAGSLIGGVPGATSMVVAAPVSGPQVGARPLPFTSNVVTGPDRGKQHCYVCALKEEPAALVFIRRLDEPTSILLRSLREAVVKHRDQKFFGWAVVLGPKDSAAEAALEQEAYNFARQHGVSALPMTVLGDPQGPPGYRIAPDAEVTVVLFRNSKVVANRAFTRQEWNAQTAASALRDLSVLLGAGRQ